MDRNMVHRRTRCRRERAARPASERARRSSGGNVREHSARGEEMVPVRLLFFLEMRSAIRHHSSKGEETPFASLPAFLPRVAKREVSGRSLSGRSSEVTWKGPLEGTPRRDPSKGPGSDLEGAQQGPGSHQDGTAEVPSGYPASLHGRFTEGSRRVHGR